MKKQLLLLFVLWVSVDVYAQESLNMRMLAHWDDTLVAPENIVGLRYNEVYGWFNPKDGREYAIIGSTDGTHIIDVTDIHNVHRVDYIKGRADSVINRDYKVKGNYVYAVGDQFRSSLQIWDMSTLPDSVRMVYDDTVFFHRSHTLWIEGDRMYATIPRFYNTNSEIGLMVFDIKNPENPIELKRYHQDMFGRVHALFTRNDTAYINGGWWNFFIADFKDYENPITLAKMAGYLYEGYNHTGWLNDKGDIYIMADETHETPVKVIDMSDKTDPKIISYLYPNPTQDKQSIPHNQFIVGDYAISSYYFDGVQIHDISDPYRPALAGFFDTSTEPYTQSFKGCWGVYPFLPSRHILASDMQNGLYVLEFAPFAPQAAESAVIYPNPATSGFVRVRTTQAMHQPVVSFFDMAGRKVWTENFIANGFELTVSFPALASGLYMMEVKEGETRLTTQKLVIQR